MFIFFEIGEMELVLLFYGKSRSTLLFSEDFSFSNVSPFSCTNKKQ